ncbi:MAG TPA: hypothetical protein VI455_20195 [Terriglobia bacterium]
MRSFLRMAAISQKVLPEEVLPLLARNVVVGGYTGQGDSRKPTEYLILLRRYLDQARELQALAGPEGVIRVPSCSQAEKLLTIIGYRLREECGPNTSLETADPERAFLTIDSGFPLASLEEALRGDKSFEVPFASGQVPILFGPNDWKVHDKYQRDKDDLVDVILRDPGLARLYWALSQVDANTRAFLWQSQGPAKLLPLAAPLDFYGSHIYVRSGRVVVPGGSTAESAWKNLVGASPDAPGEFVTRLLAKDQGWLVAYYDALARVNGTQQAYFTEPHRLPRCYEALRGQELSPGAARTVFRPDAGLLLLATRLQLDPNGQPHVPGNLDAWKQIVARQSDSKTARQWSKQASHWDNSEQLLEGMFALSRVASENGSVQVYLTLSEIDRGRAAGQRLSPQTVSLLAEHFARFHNQYLIFSEFHGLNDASIARFLDQAQAVNRIQDRSVRADALGIFQANVGLWQILARQGQIPEASWNDSWQRVISPFGHIRTSAQLFDAGRSSLGELFQAATGKPDPSQDGIIGLLSGPQQTSPEGQRVRQELGNQIRSVLEAQRLVSLDTLLTLADGLNQMAQQRGTPDRMIALAGELREFQLPKPIFTAQERAEWVSGLYNDPHTQIEMRTDLTRVIKSPKSPNQLEEARGQLAPFLRDTLVGLNYAYYEPPGAQMILHNPLFVRAHDFAGEMTMTGDQVWQTPTIFGRGWTASGGAHLAGSLADLPYVLAQVEQDFMVPENTQSLIWQDLVPCLVTSAVLPRWWRVSPNELHAVALYQRSGEELLTAAAQNEQVRERTLDILSTRLLPRRFEQVDAALRAGHPEAALSRLTPAETFYLAAEFRRRFPQEAHSSGQAGQDLETLAERHPNEVSWERISEDFGVPHPALAQTYSLELLNVKPFPTFLGYSSRLLAESWDSSNLYWARLTDEMGYSPAMLQRLIPELTRRMIENIFATDLDDWPALLRALQETGEEFRSGKIASLPKEGRTAGL